ncbi:MAG: hypothetical protein AAFN78_12485 [Pseudomonadota bacterium]
MATASAVASEPGTHRHSHASVKADAIATEKDSVEKDGGDDSALRALRARYPARPAEYRADGSIAQYIGASHLMQTAVRIGADGKLEELSTTNAKAIREFMATSDGDDSADNAEDEQ